MEITAQEPPAPYVHTLGAGCSHEIKG